MSALVVLVTIQAFGSGTHRVAISDHRHLHLEGLPARRERCALDAVLVEVTYPPGTGSPPHLHANGVMAFVVSGAVASQVGDNPEQTFHAGDAWREPEGAIHRVSRNASSTESATLLAAHIAPAGAMAADLMKPIGAIK